MNEAQPTQQAQPAVEQTPFPVMNPYNTADSAEQLKYMLENTPVNDRVELQLKGLAYDPVKECYVQKFKPLMNDEGIKMVMMLLDSHTDSNIKLSNLPEHNAREMMIKFSEALHENLILKSEDYELDLRNIRVICTLIENQVFAAMCRGEEGLEKKFLSRTMHMGFHSTNKQIDSNMYQKKSSMWDKINPFRRRE